MEVADGLREEWLALPVKQEPAVRDLILRLKAEHYGMPGRGFERLAGRTLFRNVNVLRDAERRRKLRLQSFSGDVLVESAGILGQRLYAPLEVNLVAGPSSRSRILAGNEDSLAVLVEMHREPGDAAPDFALSDGAFVSSPAVVNDIEQRRFAGFGRTRDDVERPKRELHVAALSVP